MSFITNLIVIVLAVAVAAILTYWIYLSTRAPTVVFKTPNPTIGTEVGGVPKTQQTVINTNKQNVKIYLSDDGKTLGVFDNYRFDLYSEIPTGWSAKTTIFSGTTFRSWVAVSSDVVVATRGTFPSYLDFYVRDQISGWKFLRSIVQPAGTRSDPFCTIRTKFNKRGTVLFCQLYDTMYNIVQYYILRRGTSWNEHVEFVLTGEVYLGSGGLVPGFAISGDGSFLARAVGTNNTTSEVASIYIYKYNLGGDYVLHSTIDADTTDTYVGFGQVIELDDSGKTLLTLDRRNTVSTLPFQQVYIYTRGTGVTWTRKAVFEVPPVTISYGTIETSLSMNSYGDVIAVGYATYGKIAIYVKRSETWILEAVYEGRHAALADTGKLVTTSNLDSPTSTTVITTYVP